MCFLSCIVSEASTQSLIPGVGQNIPWPLAGLVAMASLVCLCLCSSLITEWGWKVSVRGMHACSIHHLSQGRLERILKV